MMFWYSDVRVYSVGGSLVEDMQIDLIIDIWKFNSYIVNLDAY